MLILTGDLGGKSYDQQQIPALELMTALGVPSPGKYNEFRLMKGLIKMDSEGQEHYSVRIFTPIFKIQMRDGGMLQIQYAENRTGNKDNYKYAPDQMREFSSTMLIFHKDRMNLEKFVWFWLNPANANCPYRNPSKAPVYYFHDAEAEATKKMAASASRRDVMDEILSMDEDGLRIMAKGLKYRVNGGDRYVPRVNESGPKELRSNMVEMLMSDGAAFVDAWKSGSGTLKGMLRHALDAGLIIQETQNWGSYYKWGSGTHESVTITQVRTGDDPFSALVLAFTQNYADLSPILQAELNGLRETTMNLEVDKTQYKLDKPAEVTLKYIQSLGAEGIFDMALSNDVVAINRADGQVYLVQDGDLSGDPLFGATDKKAWRAELIEFMDSRDPRAKAVKNTLANAVFHAVKAKRPVAEEEIV